MGEMDDWGDDDLTGVYGEQGLDTQNNEGLRDLSEPIPAGEYLAIVANAGVKETRNRDGKYLKAEFEVLEPEEHKGRKIWAQINVQNPNPKAVEIGQRELVSLGRACGVMNVARASDLKDKVLVIRVKIENDKEYGPTNRITGYRSVDGDAAPAQQQAAPQPTAPAATQAAQPTPPAQTQPVQQPAPRAAATTGGKKPWQK